jgi:hypothetical protein
MSGSGTGSVEGPLDTGSKNSRTIGEVAYSQYFAISERASLVAIEDNMFFFKYLHETASRELELQ